MRIGEAALENFEQGFMCSESVLKSVAQAAGIDDPHVYKMASAFGSGMARTEGGLCGAMVGGMMALSLMQGRAKAGESLETLYRNVDRFKNAFEQEFGSCECAKLLGFSLNEYDAGSKFKEHNCKAEKCNHYVHFAANEIGKLLHG